MSVRRNQIISYVIYIITLDSSSLTQYYHDVATMEKFCLPDNAFLSSSLEISPGSCPWGPVAEPINKQCIFRYILRLKLISMVSYKISKSLYFTILGKCCGRCSGMAISRTGSMMSMGGSCTKAV